MADGLFRCDIAGFSLGLDKFADSDMTIDVSTNLTGWIPAYIIFGGGQGFEFLDWESAGLATKFYRLR